MAFDNTIHQITIPTSFAVGDTHAYLLRGDALSLIDAGIKTKEAMEALTIQLKQIGYTLNDIEQLILTHHHPDHTGLIDQLPRVKSIIAHENVDVWIKRDEDFFLRYEQFFKTLFSEYGIPSHFDYIFDMIRAPLQFAGEGELTGILEEGEDLPGHNEWRIIETKGHAQTHMSFFRASDGAFLGGDHLLQHISSTPLLEAPYNIGEYRAKPLLQYRANLKKCLNLNIKKVFPGHGPIFSEVEKLIIDRIKKQDHRVEQVKLLLSREKLTPFQVCQKLFPTYYKKQLEITISETIGLLDVLEEQGEIEHFYEENMLYYQRLTDNKTIISNKHN